MKRKKAALVLSGCGGYDGSEIHESVIALLNLQKLGAEVFFFAPDIRQSGVVNHLTGKPDRLERNVLEESARIARGEISPLSKFRAEDFDVLVFPGGFGAAKNLSDFAVSGASMKVNEQVADAIKAMLKLKKPIGFICISPVIGAKVIGDGVKITIGNDPQTASAINAMGAKHIDCTPDGFVRDESKNVYSTPAYMLASDTVQIDRGVGAMLSEMLKSLK